MAVAYNCMQRNSYYILDKNATTQLHGADLARSQPHTLGASVDSGMLAGAV